ncbi:hypothetical protein EGK_02217, partial [Macaca mulatta]
QGQYCDICTAANSNRAHPASNAIDGTERWWQSPPLSRGLEYNEVNVTLDLGQVFHVAYVLIKFANSPRPDLWVLERSMDFGRTYQPWQFFASSKRDCLERFGPQTLERITRDDAAICTTEYSRIVPLENPQIVVSLVNGRPGAMNFSYSPLLREFTKATNVRLRFLRTNTLLGHLMGKALRDPTVTRRYYYSIKDISIGGRCVCHGHADACDAKDPTDPFRLQCTCQHNTCGGTCDRCCPGFNQQPWKPATANSANECQSCNCHGHATDCYYDPEVDRRRASQSLDGTYQGGGVCIDCQHHTTGVNCERCLPGFYRSPDHPLDSPHVCCRCNCESNFTDGTCEDLTGRCYCRPNFSGERCDVCAEGFTGFPSCYREHLPATPSSSNDTREQVLPAGQIVMCGCSPAGTLPEGCDEAGRCPCQPGFAGPHCDQCHPGYHGFPNCQPCHCSAEGSLHAACDPRSGQCSCRPRVTGLRCDTCVPGAYNFPYCEGWSSAPTAGDSCEWGGGSCVCRANVEGPSCDRCKPGFWGLSPSNPEGCTRCSCDPRGTLGGVAECQPGTGQCFCKPHVCGQACAACKDGFFGLDQADYFGCRSCRCDAGGALGQSCEPRTGACRCRPNTQGPTCSRPVRDHYLPDLHHLRLELEEAATPEGHAVRFGFNPLEFENFSWRGYAQMAPVQTQPRIVARLNLTSPDLFWLIFRYVNRGAVSVSGRVSVRVTEACTYRPSTQQSGDNCLLYTHLPLDGFPSAAGLEALCRQDNSLPRPCPTEQLSPSHPPLVTCTGSDVDVQLQVAVPQPGRYALVVEYANEDARQEVGVAVHTPQRAPQQGLLSLHPCLYSTARDTQDRLAVFHLDSEANVRLTAEQAHFYLHGVTLVPMEEFSPEFVEPRVRCISSHGAFGPSSAACLPSRFPKPPQPIILRDCQVIPLPPGLPLTQAQDLMPATSPTGPQATVVFTTHVPTLGRYAFLLHGYQPAHPTFPVEVLINAGRVWQGECLGCGLEGLPHTMRLERCSPHPSPTFPEKPGSRLCLDYVLVVPENVYSFGYLREEPLDKSYDFISHCAAQGYHISPGSSSLFCRNAAASLSLFYNNGARPCGCHEVGATGPTCEPFGGQCPCRAHVIGRDCSRCATGYWGFPNCRPCDCGARLCDELTGQCICPPRTVPPECLLCQPQTFGCHPLVGCEECNCSGPGVQELTDPTCDTDSGQCKCRPNVTGRRCDTCSPGFHGYPHCRPCDCHEAGTAPGVCDPLTGQCYCKENVQGPRCDQCSLGTFSLD